MHTLKPKWRSEDMNPIHFVSHDEVSFGQYMVILWNEKNDDYQIGWVRRIDDDPEGRTARLHSGNADLIEWTHWSFISIANPFE